ncbi:acyl-CoA-binding domain-containing protein 5-like [Branchiostoma floridae]|uniref:Acyl-CoA-binding domain-containing protein 5-like n=2 Tax=Branchiostoma floridae TaxID=7739 RepID=A0A9J7HF58_BRAFL|nr:acyl-CoA-binding domain-containing protein 5-like [Branchiostoma floridae]
MAAPKARFDAAVKVIQSLPKNGSITPSHETMLTFYGYYKQATIGPCDISRPGFWDVVGKAKWEAWNRLGNMPKEEAMDNYVDTLKKIIEALPQDKEMQDFMHVLGPFYELVDLESPYQAGKSSLDQSEPSISDQPVLAIKENGEIPTNHVGESETLDDLQTNNNKITEKSTENSEENETEVTNQMQDRETGNTGVQEEETNHRGGDVSTNHREEEVVTNQREAEALTNHKQAQGDSSQSEDREVPEVEVEEVKEEVQPGKGIYDGRSPYGNQVTTPPVTKVMLMEIPTPPVIIDTPLPAKHHGKGPNLPDEDGREDSLPRRLNGHSYPAHHVNSDSDTDSELYQDTVDTPAIPDEMPGLISRQAGATSPSSQSPEGLPRSNSFVTQAEIHHDSNGLPSHGSMQQTEGMAPFSIGSPLANDSSGMEDSHNSSLSMSPLVGQGRSGDVERRLELESPAVIGRGGGEMGGQGKGQGGQMGSRRQSGDSTSSGGRGRFGEEIFIISFFVLISHSLLLLASLNFFTVPWILNGNPVKCQRLLRDSARDRGGTPGRRGAGGYYGGGGGDDGERGRGRGQGSSDVNEHIAVALDRLQQDMNFVLARLSTLEALSTSQARGGIVAPAVQAVQPQQQQESSWWPFSNLSGKTAFFILVWPFIVNWLIKLYLKKKSKAHRRSPFM